KQDLSPSATPPDVRGARAEAGLPSAALPRKEPTMRRAFFAAVVATMALAATALPAPALADDHHNGRSSFEGRVLSVDRTARTFRLRDQERGTVTIKVTRTTKFEDFSGFTAALRPGRKLEVKAHRVNGSLVATKIERFSSSNDDS